MQYLIIEKSPIIIEEEIKKIISSFIDSNIIKYDLSETSIDTIISELDTYDFLGTKKIVIGYNALFLTSSKTNTEDNIEKFIKYIDNPNKDNILILTTESIDKRKKIVGEIEKKFKVIIPSINLYDYVKNNLEGYKISNQTINYLIDYLLKDINKLYNEIEKLKIYKINDKIITIDDINKCVTKYIDTNIFGFIDAVIYKNKEHAYEIYNELIKTEDPQKLLITIANQIRLIYQVKVLSKRGLNEPNIVSFLKAKPYSVKLAKEKGRKYTEDELINNLSKLADIDFSIKSGKSLKDVSIILFLMQL